RSQSVHGLIAPPYPRARQTVSIMLALEVEHRAFGHDEGGVDSWVGVVADLDMLQVYRLAHARPLIEFAQVVREAGVILQTAGIALERAVVSGVEAYQCDEQPPVGL